MQTGISLVQGDICTVQADAIVNAAYTSLMGGSGVDGAIHRAGGPAILAECMEIRTRRGGCKVGEAVMTTAGNLPARCVIHTVGPVWCGGGNGENALLAQAYRNALALAEERKLRSVAFPNISTGIYRFPKPRAAEIALSTCSDFLATARFVRSVCFVCFDAENFRIYRNLLG